MEEWRGAWERGCNGIVGGSSCMWGTELGDARGVIMKVVSDCR